MHERILVTLAAVSCLLGMFFTSAPHANADQEPLVVVVAANFPAADVPYATLKAAFKGRVASLAGQRLIPINHPMENPLRQRFDKTVLGLSGVDVGRFWVDVRIRDSGRPPTTAASSELAMRIVASLANAVSYATPAMLAPKLKVLTVDGKSASQPDYPLRQH